MKISLLILGLLSFSFSQAATLKGSIKPEPVSEQVFLFVFHGDQLRLIDSAKIKKGSFSFQSREGGFPTGLYKVGLSKDLSGIVVLGKENIRMEVIGKDWENASLSGSEEVVLFSVYRKFNNGLMREFQILNQKFNNLSPLASSNNEKYRQEVFKLQGKLDSLLKTRKDNFTQWVQKKEAPYMCKVIRMLSDEATESPEKFFRKEDVLDPELQRSFVWTERMNTYLQLFGGNDAELMSELASQTLKLAGDSKDAKEILYRAAALSLRNLEDQGIHSGYQIARKYRDEFPGQASDAFLDYFNAGPPSEGEMAPEISLPNREGVVESLSNLRGKVVLIDFWASWCGPCRHENPVVVKAWKRFEPKGFTVFSVSLDQGKEKWLAAIAKDGLAWNNHVSDLKGWQSAGASAYSVRSIPATFLIDRDGKIVGKNLRGAALESKLEELLGP
jgi:peroxiredoxin